MNFNVRLIDLISGHEVLYNPYHPDRKNKLVLEKTWKAIVLEMNASGLNDAFSLWFTQSTGFIYTISCLVESVKKRWTCLRTNFGKKHRNATNTASGSAAQPKERWPYYKQMKFVGHYIRHRVSYIYCRHYFIIACCK